MLLASYSFACRVEVFPFYCPLIGVPWETGCPFLPWAQVREPGTQEGSKCRKNAELISVSLFYDQLSDPRTQSASTLQSPMPEDTGHPEVSLPEVPHLKVSSLGYFCPRSQISLCSGPKIQRNSTWDSCPWSQAPTVLVLSWVGEGGPHCTSHTPALPS